jgi:hypothetical protein
VTEEAAAIAQGPALHPLPKRSRIKVAFMLGDGANVIDTAGSWEMFQDVTLPGFGHSQPFELYTVAPTDALMTGGLTSGIDMALHVVARYFGVAAAARTAEYMEYTSDAWRA